MKLQEQFIQVELSDLRDICRLPSDVEVIDAFPRPIAVDARMVSGNPPMAPLLVKIRHRHAFWSNAGEHLVIEKMNDFLERTAALSALERARKAG